MKTGIYDTISHCYSEWVPTNYGTYTYNESTSWIRVVDFYDYWRGRITVVNRQRIDDVIPNSRVGDVVQMFSTTTGE